MKKVVIERRTYAFMRSKESTTLRLVDEIMDNINDVHHKAFTSAESRMKKFKERALQEGQVFEKGIMRYEHQDRVDF